MLKLSQRLLLAASFVRQGAFLADIGTDHAYIPAYLIKEGVIEKACASDVNEGPLQNAAKTLSKENISGVSLVLSDGMKNVDLCGVDDILIAGMGGELISRILLEDERCKNKSFNFILQPMTKADFLCKSLYENGFEIIRRSLCAEGEKIYTVMLVKYSGEKKAISEAFALLGLPDGSELFEIKKQRELKRLKKIYNSIKDKEEFKEYSAQTLKLINEIEVYQ